MRLDRRLRHIAFFALFALLTTLQSAYAQEELFADTIYVGNITLGGNSVSCPSVTLASLPVRVKTRSRIVAYGSGVYHQNGSDLNVVALHIALQENNNTVAVSNNVPITAPYSGNVDPNNGNAFGAVELLANSSSAIKTANGAPTAQPTIPRGQS